MPARQCYHCKNWIEEGEPHDCWTTTEAALTRDLSEDLREAWERLRETAAEFGEQRIYASLNSIMFSRRSCYFFVRPKRKYLEVCVFLGRTVNAPPVHRAEPAWKTKTAHLLRITHRDQVEEPVTGWLREAYDFAAPSTPAPSLSRKGGASGRRAAAARKVSAAARKRVKPPRRPVSTRAATAAPRPRRK